MAFPNLWEEATSQANYAPAVPFQRSKSQNTQMCLGKENQVCISNVRIADRELETAPPVSVAHLEGKSSVFRVIEENTF